jgi:hypothetical protein
LDLKKLDISPKDGLVAIPVIGTILAISYEIGSFMPIGLPSFGLFSLSEHVLFAMEVFPVTIPMAIGLTIGLATISPLERKLDELVFEGTYPSGRPTQRDRDQIQRIRWWAFAWVIVSAVFAIGLGAYTGFDIFFVVGAVFFGFALLFAFPRLNRKELLLPIFAIFILVAAMAIGIDNTKLQLDRSIPYDFDINGTVDKGIFLRSGDRGVLIFEPSSSTFVFVKRELMKRISWPRKESSIRR